MGFLFLLLSVLILIIFYNFFSQYLCYIFSKMHTIVFLWLFCTLQYLVVYLIVYKNLSCNLALNSM